MKAPLKKHLRPLDSDRAGNSLIMVLGIISLAALLTASSIRVTAARYRNTHCSTSWNRAIFAAEGAADVAITAIRQNNWVATGWSAAPGNPGDPPVTKQVILQSNPILSGATLNVDTVMLGGKTWYRIRSQGWADLPGSPEAAPDKHDNTLRKLSLRTDRETGTSVTNPRVSRIVEILAEPVGPKPFARALLARQVYGIPNDAIVDSFDSSNITKSTGGLYDIAKRQYNGHIATLDTAAWNLNNSYIYGDALSPNGNATNSTNVQGDVKDLFAFTFPTITAPTWAIIHQNYGSVDDDDTIIADAGTTAAPRRYKFDAIDFNGGGSLRIKLPAGETEGHVEIWVPGNVTLNGGGTIIVDPGVKATLHVGNNVFIDNAGLVNSNQRADKVVIQAYGGNASTHPSFEIDDTNFWGAVYAPWCHLTLNSNNRDISGSFVAYDLTVDNDVRLHYDEVLGTVRLGETGDLAIRSWVEAVR
jgi:hypothetical protein